MQNLNKNLLSCCIVCCCRFFAFTTAEIGVRTILLPIPTNKGLPRFCCDGLNTAAVLNRLIGLCRLFGVVTIGLGLNEAEVIFGGIVGIFPFNLFGFSFIPFSFPVSMAFSFPIRPFPSFSGWLTATDGSNICCWLPLRLYSLRFWITFLFRLY